MRKPKASGRIRSNQIHIKANLEGYGFISTEGKSAANKNELKQAEQEFNKWYQSAKPNRRKPRHGNPVGAIQTNDTQVLTQGELLGIKALSS